MDPQTDGTTDLERTDSYVVFQLEGESYALYERQFVTKGRAE